MKAMILAAGLGSRLKPLTDSTPKALIPIQGKCMLERLIVKLRSAGCRDVVVNVHHFGEQIISFLDSHNNFGINIAISDERKYLLDTGGALKHAAALLEGNKPFLVHNVDVLSDIDLKAFYGSHKPEALATLLVSKRTSSRYLLFNREDKLCGWRNKETGEVKSFYPNFDPSLYSEYAFGGIHVISPKIFEIMEEWTGKFSIIDFYLSVCAKNMINAHCSQGTLIDIGKPESLERARTWVKPS